MLWYNVCTGLPASSMRKMLTGKISERKKIQVFDILYGYAHRPALFLLIGQPVEE